MGGLFSSSAPAPSLPTAPAAPVEEATFKPGGDEKGRKKLKTVAAGKKKLQIPLTSGAKKAVRTGV